MFSSFGGWWWHWLNVCWWVRWHGGLGGINDIIIICIGVLISYYMYWIYHDISYYMYWIYEDISDYMYWISYDISYYMYWISWDISYCMWWVSYMYHIICIGFPMMYHIICIGYLKKRCECSLIEVRSWVKSMSLRWRFEWGEDLSGVKIWVRWRF